MSAPPEPAAPAPRSALDIVNLFIAGLALVLTLVNFGWDQWRTERTESFESEELVNEAWNKIRQRDLETASDLVYLAHFKDEDNARVHALRGYLQHLGKAYHEAAGHYRAALAIDADYVRAQIFLADSLVQATGESDVVRKRDLEEAERLLQSAKRLAERSSDRDSVLVSTIHLSLGHLRQAQKRSADAHDLYRRACERAPSNLDARASYARALVDRGELWQAIDQYNELLAIEPGWADGWTGLGWTLYGQGLYRSAEIALQRSVELAPRTADYRLLSLTLREQGRNAEADAILAQSWRALDVVSLGSVP